MRRAIFDVVVLAGLAFVSTAQAKTLKEELVGTWLLSSVVTTSDNGEKTMPYGDHPLGTYMFDADGHFSEMILDPNKENVLIAFFGTYSGDDTGKGFVLHIIGGSPIHYIGTDAKRDVLSIADDVMQTRNVTPSRGNGPAVSDWKRAQ